MWSLVLVYPTFTIPFCSWLLMGFFKALPPEIEEAAIVEQVPCAIPYLGSDCVATPKNAARIIYKPLISPASIKSRFRRLA